jgi:hypothetical protein
MRVHEYVEIDDEQLILKTRNLGISAKAITKG